MNRSKIRKKNTLCQEKNYGTNVAVHNKYRKSISIFGNKNQILRNLKMQIKKIYNILEYATFE